MTLKSVVLPAPFGPINPVMCPASAVRVVWSSARFPPNDNVTARTSSIAVTATHRRGGMG